MKTLPRTRERKDGNGIHLIRNRSGERGVFVSCAPRLGGWAKSLDVTLILGSVDGDLSLGSRLRSDLVCTGST